MTTETDERVNLLALMAACQSVRRIQIRLDRMGIHNRHWARDIHCLLSANRRQEAALCAIDHVAPLPMSDLDTAIAHLTSALAWCEQESVTEHIELALGWLEDHRNHVAPHVANPAPAIPAPDQPESETH